MNPPDKNNEQSACSRWNATYEEGTTVTVSPKDRPPFDAITAGEAYTKGAAFVPVSPTHRLTLQGRTFEPCDTITVPLEQIEHRIVLDPATEQALRATGHPPLSELDPEPLVNLRDIPCGRWLEFDARWLEIPHAIAGYIAKLITPPTPTRERGGGGAGSFVEQTFTDRGADPMVRTEKRPVIRRSMNCSSRWNLQRRDQ